ncbi:hypothetical protein [Treponema sp. JC4]|uniref:hypothetical protein n=1 Tax=Treponema sp. JC4 TaxID=1124982 RepID=UPI0012DFC64B|nr:hypothetical protein [Treponema sp. JC4]
MIFRLQHERAENNFQCEFDVVYATEFENWIAEIIIWAYPFKKDRVLFVGGFERATLPFAGIQRAEPFGGYGVEKKSGENFLLGKVSFARAFRNGRDKGSRGYALAQ